ncbi:hypothetical protein PISMIDRAFT_673999 [Pisolithus microcarpus 441]|uniref:Uncharacterized protein n=1 Tax=Pisolithus microcarpus 441 TaxID=765257 RepID=A0A0C9YTK0_9AGAM|nr:hypothetical protein PISMIDRAFT_673999 [Pisolithus microcarpus 441]
MEDLVASTLVLFQTLIFMTVPLPPIPATIIGRHQTLREATLTPSSLQIIRQPPVTAA